MITLLLGLAEWLAILGFVYSADWLMSMTLRFLYWLNPQVGPWR